MAVQSATKIKGIPASPGIAIGPVFLYGSRRLAASKRHVDDAKSEITRLDAALDQAKTELQELYKRAREGAGSGEAEIFHAHVLMLEDPELIERVRGTVEREGCNAEYAWHEGVQYYASLLRGIDDEYLVARAADLEDVEQRVQRILQGVAQEVAGPVEPSVITAADLSPSDIVTFDKQKALAFCTASGGPASHVAILSKALGIPAVVGLGEALHKLAKGATVIVDGGAGEVLVQPGEAAIREYKHRGAALQEAGDLALQSAGKPAVTLDGAHFEVVANINSPQDVVDALKYGAEGVGLLRTEFLFLGRDSAPTEEEQSSVYRSVLETMGRRPVVIRTLDLGGDKPAPYLDMPPEVNPFLGVRGARLSFARPELFQTQLRAMLRAGEGHNLKIMAPMISSLEEVHALRAQIDEARSALRARGVQYSTDLEVGIMVEVPSAALMADLLAPAVDFFSIGTNDLSQYTLAADRTNPGVASLADAFHPAVLRLIGMVAAAAHAHGKRLGLCGELAGDPLATPLLLGLGVDELSMSPRAIPAVKQAVRRYSLDQAQEIARRAVSLPTAADVRDYLKLPPPGT
jgi:phosphoenolpyruvate-protein phosphotransferase